jgi:hypothetical protein
VEVVITEFGQAYRVARQILQDSGERAIRDCWSTPLVGGVRISRIRNDWGGVIARSEATKQSRGRAAALDCFAPLAMTASASVGSRRAICFFSIFSLCHEVVGPAGQDSGPRTRAECVARGAMLDTDAPKILQRYAAAEISARQAAKELARKRASMTCSRGSSPRICICRSRPPMTSRGKSPFCWRFMARTARIRVDEAGLTSC